MRTRTYLDLRTLADEQQDLRERHLAVLNGDTATPLDDDEFAYLESLNALAMDLGYRNGDFDLGQHDDTTLIPEYEWEDYCRELAYDIGAVGREAQFESYVDWEKWANAVAMDYSTVDFEGTTYYYREG